VRDEPENPAWSLARRCRGAEEAGNAALAGAGTESRFTRDKTTVRPDGVGKAISKPFIRPVFQLRDTPETTSSLKPIPPSRAFRGLEIPQQRSSG